MNDQVTSIDRDAVLAGVVSACEAAGIDILRPTTAIVPLQKFVAAYPLTWYEVPHLTQRTSTTYLRARVGRSIAPHPDRDEALAGRLYATSVGGCILVEQMDPVTRRRFSVAHELGHYVLHFLPRLSQGPLIFDEELPLTDDERDEDAGRAGRPLLMGLDGRSASELNPTQMEAEADLFAAEILMPEALCRELVHVYLRRTGGREAVLGRILATECLVSQSAMNRRLRELNLPASAA